jgi:uncharacterized damage-inducible protein DinB
MEHTRQVDTVASSFLAFSRNKLIDQYWPRLRTCIERLTDEQVWWRPNESSNSIGNLVLHLNGNVRQWLVASFGNLADTRERNTEFAAEGGLSAAQLVNTIAQTMQRAEEILAQLTDAELTKRYVIQGYNVTGLEAVYQVVEHFGLHYGQIVYITKWLRNEDLGFYRSLSATGRATGSETTLA